MQNQPDLRFLPLAKARSRNPLLKAFGQRLEQLRGTKSRQQISNRLNDLGVPLGGATLAQYEAGTVWAPDPGVLWGLAEIYGEQLDTLIALLRANRKNTAATEWSDLLRPTRREGSGSHQEVPDALPAASPTTRRLESSSEPDRALASEVSNALGILTRVYERLGGQSAATAATPPARRRSHRKTG